MLSVKLFNRPSLQKGLFGSLIAVLKGYRIPDPSTIQLRIDRNVLNAGRECNDISPECVLEILESVKQELSEISQTSQTDPDKTQDKPL